jgi:hypothetical protein
MSRARISSAKLAKELTHQPPGKQQPFHFYACMHACPLLPVAEFRGSGVVTYVPSGVTTANAKAQAKKNISPAQHRPQRIASMRFIELVYISVC